MAKKKTDVVEEVIEEVEEEKSGPLKIKVRLKEWCRNQVQLDPETGNMWVGDKVIETTLTAFVRQRLGKTLEEVE